MCGIVGFTGRQQAAPILLNGLSKLEYRGYDSAGIAVRDGERLAQVVKAKGRLGNLIEKTDEGKALIGTCGIGHTRWATHGEPSQINAHPHVSGNCTRSGSGEVESEVVGVHNGIIENYTELKEKLLKHGYTFYSQTDTEVVIKLVDYYYKKYNLGPIDAIAKTMVRVRGSYALELMFKDYPGEIWVARKDSPMIIGVTDGETYVASDVPAILQYTRNVYYIGNLDLNRPKKSMMRKNMDNMDMKYCMKRLSTRTVLGKSQENIFRLIMDIVYKEKNIDESKMSDQEYDDFIKSAAPKVYDEIKSDIEAFDQKLQQFAKDNGIKKGKLSEGDLPDEGYSITLRELLEGKEPISNTERKKRMGQ